MPNLEAKFVAANSLIPLAKQEDSLGRTPDIITLENKLKEANHKIFSAKTVRTKRKWKTILSELRTEMAEKLAENGFLTSSAANQIASWDMFNQNSAASFFDADWMFGIKDGFDIVIGNPPYIDIKGLPIEDVKLYFKLFQTTENRINLYSIFIEKGTYLLSSKGLLCFINPNSILINESYLKIRELIINYIDTIIKLPDTVFESANVETIILLLRKNNSTSEIRGAYFKKNDSIQFEKLSFNLFSRELWQNDSDKRFNIFTTNRVRNLLNKIKDNSVELGTIVETSLGITPYDKYKGHDEKTIKNRLFHADTKLDSSYVPLVSGKNIHAFYVSEEIDEYLKYGEWLGAPRERKFFEGEKIIIRQILSGEQQHIIAAYSNKPHFFTQIGFSLILQKGNSVLTKFLVCLLNSELMTFYHRNMFLDVEKVVFQKILIANTKKLPIKLPTDLSPYVDFVDSGRYDNGVSKINKLIYKLYDLTYDEVLIVDPETPITREEYEKDL